MKIIEVNEFTHQLKTTLHCDSFHYQRFSLTANWSKKHLQIYFSTACPKNRVFSHNKVEDIYIQPKHYLLHIRNLAEEFGNFRIHTKDSFLDGFWQNEFMIIGSRQRVPLFEQDPLIKLGDKVIKRVPHMKHLVLSSMNNVSGINISRNKVK